MKKITAIMLILTMLFALGACGGSAKEAEAPAAEAPTAEAPAAEAPADEAPAVEVGKYKCIIASAGTSGDCLNKAYQIFKDKVEAETNGEIAVEIFMDSQLGAMADYIGGLQLDSIQMCDIASSVLASTTPEFMAFDLPYLVTSADQELRFFNDSIGQQLADAVYEDTGLTVGGYIVRNPRNVYSSKGPINSAADFNGLVIRTMDATAMISAMELLGATATPIATAERYLALQTHVVDAAENNVSEIYNCKEYEVTDYLSKTEHLIQPNVVVIGAEFLESLPEEYRTLVLETIKDACNQVSQEEIDNASVYEQLLIDEGGMIVNEVSDEAKAEFKSLMDPLYEKYGDEIGLELIEAIKNYQ